MNYFFWILIIIVFFYEIYLVYRSRKFFAYIKNNENKKIGSDTIKEKSSEYEICILLPCHKEQNLIKLTYEYYYSMFKDIENVLIVFITGEEDTNIDSHYSINKEIRKNKLNNIILIHNLSNSNTKSDKLNYAINKLLEKNYISYKTYIGVYDFDARPNISTVGWILDSINDSQQNQVSVYQEVPVTINNIDRACVYNRLFFIWHLRRTFGIEGSKSIDNGRRKINYCMGSGMYINLSDLVIVGGFPPNDDISLGYELFIRNKEEVIVPFYNTNSVTYSFKSLFKQYIKIFDGLFTYNKIQKKYKLSFLIKIKKYIQVYLDALFEFIEFLIFLLNLFFLNFYQIIAFYILYFIIFIYYFYFGYRIFRIKLNISFKFILMFLLAPISNIIFRFIVVILYPFYIKKIDNMKMEVTEK